MTWKEHYFYCKSLGICTHYGCLRPAATGKVKCDIHLEYDRKHHAKYKKAAESSTGISIAEANAKARELHMTYGQYMALKRGGKI